MSNKQNDINLDNLIDRMENLGIFPLLVTSDKGFRIEDLELLEKYTSYFESLDPMNGETRYFWCIGELKNKIECDRAKKITQTTIKPLLDKLIETNTEYSTIKNQPISKESTIL